MFCASNEALLYPVLLRDFRNKKKYCSWIQEDNEMRKKFIFIKSKLSEKSGDGEKNENKVSFSTFTFYLVLSLCCLLCCCLKLKKILWRRLKERDEKWNTNKTDIKMKFLCCGSASTSSNMYTRYLRLSRYLNANLFLRSLFSYFYFLFDFFFALCFVCCEKRSWKAIANIHNIFLRDWNEANERRMRNKKYKK